MDQPSWGKGALPITSGSPPRRIPRPERYEVDDTPLSPPGSNYLLFDSSSVFKSHPHKYKLLIKNGSKDDQSLHGQACDGGGHKLLEHQRSKSLVSLPSALKIDSLKVDSDSAAPTGSNLLKEHRNEAIARDQHTLEQFLRSSHRRRSADSLSTGTGFQQPHSFVQFGSHHKDEAEEDKLLKNFNDAVNLREDNPVSFQVQPFEDSMSSGSEATPKEKQSSVPSSSEESPPRYVVKEVQPEPRRLFGFGPLYKPLPEVVVETYHPLTERVRKEGITAVGVDTADARKTSTDKTLGAETTEAPHRKKSTSTKETSMWMPFSF